MPRGDVDKVTSNQLHPTSYEPQAETPRLTIDAETFTVTYAGVTCELKNTKEFAVLARLNIRPGVYVSIDEVITAGWEDSDIEENTVQQTISSLRRKLKTAGITGVEIDGVTNRKHYALKLK